MGTRVYVGRVPYRAGERDLERFFRGYGKIVEVILKNGYGFVEFSDHRDAEDACHDLSGRELMGERISVELAKGTPRGRDRNGWQPPPRSAGGRDNRRGDDRGRRDDRGRFGGSSGSTRKRDSERTEYRLTVENLSSKVSWQDLKDAFRSVGEVTYADAHGKHKNEGLVEFATREDMKKAMEKMDGKELQGRKIKLTEEKASKRRSRSRSKDRKKDNSASRSRSRSGSGSRSRSGEPDEKADKKNGKKKEDADEAAGGNDNDNKEGAEAEVEAASRKRSRSPSAGSESQSPAPDADKNGEGSPATKRQRADSDEKSAEGDADGVGDDDE